MPDSHNKRVYAAPSLSEVLNQLLMYRPSGVLTIWRAAGIRQDDARITIEQGRLLHVYWRAYKEDANERMLAWLNNWGQIHFSFQSAISQLQLPPPTSQHSIRPEQPVQRMQPTQPIQPGQPSRPAPIYHDTPIQPAQPRRRSSVTQPLNAIPATNSAARNAAVNTGRVQENAEEYGRTQELPLTQLLRQQEELRDARAKNNPSTSIAHETVIASLTQLGREYPAAHLPRHDRTIFLLINGRRTVVDLAQLTNRSLEVVYTTLLRLKNAQLITIEVRNSRTR
jgi:hypothetical protein